MTTPAAKIPAAERWQAEARSYPLPPWTLLGRVPSRDEAGVLCNAALRQRRYSATRCFDRTVIRPCA